MAVVAPAAPASKDLEGGLEGPAATTTLQATVTIKAATTIRVVVTTIKVAATTIKVVVALTTTIKVVVVTSIRAAATATHTAHARQRRKEEPVGAAQGVASAAQFALVGW